MTESNQLPSKKQNISDFKTYHIGVIEAAAHRALRQHKDELLREYGISGIEWYLIGTVADAGDSGARITDLALILGTTQGFLTKTVNMLEAKGIVRRAANAKDARSNFVVLQESYRSTVDEIEAALRHKLKDSLYSRISPDDLKTYLAVLSTFTTLK